MSEPQSVGAAVAEVTAAPILIEGPSEGELDMWRGLYRHFYEDEGPE